MKTLQTIILAGLTLLATTAPSRNRQPLPKAPAAQYAKYKEAGDKIMKLVNGNVDEELHALIILKDGRKVYEAYADGHTKDELHVLWSTSKTLLSLAVGFAIDEGLIKIDDKMVKYFDDTELPPAAQRSPYLEQITIRHLLTMTTGWKTDHPILTGNRLMTDEWLRPQLASEFIAAPGTRQAYHSGSSNTLSAIITKVTGLTLGDYLKKKLFRHLGIHDYISQTSPEGYGAAGWGFYMSAESLAKVGQFIVQKGNWKGKQLLSRSYIEEATRPQVATYLGHESNYTPEKLAELKNTPSDQKHYGYQIWIGRDNSFRMHGAYGQLCLGWPDRNLVVVTTSHARNDWAIINAIFDYVLKVE